jgi:hypothetical protein
MKRSEILASASHLINNDRAQTYGDAKENFSDIAVGWSVITGVDLTPGQVGLMMNWLKTCRAVKSPDHLDSYVDAAAYMALAGEIETEKEEDNVKPFTRQA